MAGVAASAADRLADLEAEAETADVTARGAVADGAAFSESSTAENEARGVAADARGVFLSADLTTRPLEFVVAGGVRGARVAGGGGGVDEAAAVGAAAAAGLAVGLAGVVALTGIALAAAAAAAVGRRARIIEVISIVWSPSSNEKAEWGALAELSRAVMRNSGPADKRTGEGGGACARS